VSVTDSISTGRRSKAPSAAFFTRTNQLSPFRSNASRGAMTTFSSSEIWMSALAERSGMVSSLLSQI